MSKGKRGKTSGHLPKAFIVVPFTDQPDSNDSSALAMILNSTLAMTLNFAFDDLRQHAVQSLRTLTHKASKRPQTYTVHPRPLSLENSSFAEPLRNYREQVTEPGSFVCISAHGNPKFVTSKAGHKLSSRELAAKLESALGENLAQLKEVRFLTCNSAYHSNDYSQSYAGQFKVALEARGARDVTVVGYIGYLEEDGRNKHTYVTQSPVTARGRKIRIEEQSVTFRPTGEIIPPESPLVPFIPGEDDTEVEQTDVNHTDRYSTPPRARKKSCQKDTPPFARRECKESEETDYDDMSLAERFGYLTPPSGGFHA